MLPCRIGGASGVGSLREGLVEPVLQDRGDRAVAGRADVVAAPAGGLERLGAIALGEAAGCRGTSGSPARDAASPS